MKKNILTALMVGALALSASAQNYKVVVKSTDGTTETYETNDINSISFEVAPNYVGANNLFSAEYTTSNDLGKYYISFGTGAMDSYGNPADIGDINIAVELSAAKSDDSNNAVIPAGYYLAGNGSEAGQFNVQQSAVWIRLADGDAGVSISPIIDGTVDVRHDDSGYDIRCEVTMLTGETVNIAYTGPISFKAGLTEDKVFEEDQVIDFTAAQARYYANWFYPFADDLTLQLFNGEFDDNEQQIEGYWLSVSLYEPKADNPKNPKRYIEDGVYTVDPRTKVLDYTNLPFTFTKGRYLDFWGVQYLADTYITYIGKNGQKLTGLIDGGTITISNNATKVVVDLVTDNGIKISGEYTGAITVGNFNDSEKAPVIEGSITSDVVADFIPGTIAMSYPLGDYIKEGLYQYSVMITDQNMEKGDYLALELSSEDPNSLPDGTYTIDNEIKPFTGLKGFINYGGIPLFSWFANLDEEDEEGVQLVQAPIMGGTVTFTTTGVDKKKIELNLVDEDGHTITGSYEGTFYNLSAVESSPALKVKARK